MPLNTLQLARGLNTIIESFTLATGTNYDLPSTGIKAGQMVILFNETANNSELTIRASGGTTVETIAKGYCLLVSKVATPTLSANWQVLDVYEEIRNITVTWAGCIPSTNTTENRLVRHNKEVSAFMTAFVSDVTATSTGNLVSNSFIPSRMSAGGFAGFARAKNGSNNNFLRMVPVTVATTTLNMYGTMLDSNAAGTTGFSSGNLVNIWENFYLKWNIN